MRLTALFIRRELANALRARWFLAYSLAFLAGGLLLATLGVGDVTVAGYRGFAKAFGGLVHLALLVVPLMALFPAIAALADERESGALEYLLAQPVAVRDVFLGKWMGVTAAISLSLAVGFGFAGGVAVARGVPPGLILFLFGFVLLLGVTFVSLGLLLTAANSSRARAATLGVIAWLSLVALGTLGIMAAFVRWGLPEGVLVAWSLINPIEAFRLAIVSALDPDLSLLGPVGASVLARLGSAGTVALAAGSLAAWAAGAAATGLWYFRRDT
jgi:Cu-processing system permease protein